MLRQRINFVMPIQKLGCAFLKLLILPQYYDQFLNKQKTI